MASTLPWVLPITMSAWPAGNSILPWTLPVNLGTTPAVLGGHGGLTGKLGVKEAAGLAGHGALSGVAARLVAVGGHGALSGAARLYSIVDWGYLTGHGVLSADAFTYRFAGRGALTGPARLYRIAVPAAWPGHGELSASLRLKLAITVGVSGRGALSGNAQIIRAATLSGHGALSVKPPIKAAIRGVLGSAATSLLGGAPGLSVNAKLTHIKLPGAISGHGTLGALVTPIGVTRLTFFEVTGTFMAVVDPPPGGADNVPLVQPISALITFTPRLAAGQPLYVADCIIIETPVQVSTNTAVILPPLTARIWNGLLSTIDMIDTPGFQLLANVDLNINGQLIYDVTFDKVVFAGSSQVLAPFAIVAPNSSAPVDITSTVSLSMPRPAMRVRAPRVAARRRTPTPCR
jgi:hypothetical protein